MVPYHGRIIKIYKLPWTDLNMQNVGDRHTQRERERARDIERKRERERDR
jgi:hypothetical protein